MHIMIAGGTGFVGQALVAHFLDQGHQITIVGRFEEKIQTIYDSKVTAITWEALAPKGGDILSGVHWLINLTGANLGTQKWTKERKEIISKSRTEVTDYLAKLCAKLKKQAPVFFNASAIGVYSGINAACTEDTEIDFEAPSDFLTEVAYSWEQATLPAEKAGVRVVKLRFGVILGQGGALEKMTPFFKLGLGGSIGSGKQPFCWVAMQDVVRAIDFIYENESLSGPINITAPAHNTQGELASALGKALGRPAFWPTPSWLIKFMYGQMGEELLLKGQKVAPERLQQANFTFECANLESVLNPLYQQEKQPKEQNHEPPGKPPEAI
jgi:uncharacterized protein